MSNIELFSSSLSKVAAYFPSGPFERVFFLDYYDGMREGFGSRASGIVSYCKLVWQDISEYLRLYEVSSISLSDPTVITRGDLLLPIANWATQNEGFPQFPSSDQVAEFFRLHGRKSYMLGRGGVDNCVLEIEHEAAE